MNVEDMKDFVNEMPDDVLMAGKTMSVCAIFIHEQLIAASIEELCIAMKARFEKLGDRDIKIPSLQDIRYQVLKTVEWAIARGAMEKSIVPNKYSPTYSGWDMAQLWINNLNSCTFQKSLV